MLGPIGIHIGSGDDVVVIDAEKKHRRVALHGTAATHVPATADEAAMNSAVAATLCNNVRMFVSFRRFDEKRKRTTSRTRLGNIQDKNR